MTKALIAARAMALIAFPAFSWAQSNAAFTQTQAVPTLDEWGLIGLVVAVGVIGGLVMRGRGKK